METLIKQLVTMDREMREQIKREEERLEKCREEVAAEAEKVRVSYQTRAHKKIEQMKRENQQELDRQGREAERRYQDACRRLEEEFERKHERWTQEIVARCLSPGGTEG